MYYIYYLIDPRTSLTFYVGKGKGNRVYDHLNGRDAGVNKRKDAKIAKIRRLGLEPIIEYPVTNIIDENIAYRLEDDHILMFGRKDYDANRILTNICINAVSSAKMPEARVKNRLAHLGKVTSEKTKEKQSLTALSKGDNHQAKSLKLGKSKIFYRLQSPNFPTYNYVEKA
jgi:hypothetical protein